MPKWEYKILTADRPTTSTIVPLVRFINRQRLTPPRRIDEVLNEMGQEGWELVAAVWEPFSLPASSRMVVGVYELILKRPGEGPTD